MCKETSSLDPSMHRLLLSTLIEDMSWPFRNYACRMQPCRSLDNWTQNSKQELQPCTYTCFFYNIVDCESTKSQQNKWNDNYHVMVQPTSSRSLYVHTPELLTLSSAMILKTYMTNSSHHIENHFFGLSHGHVYRNRYTVMLHHDAPYTAMITKNETNNSSE